jgi:hypothetical protein
LGYDRNFSLFKIIHHFPHYLSKIRSRSQDLTVS